MDDTNLDTNSSLNSVQVESSICQFALARTCVDIVILSHSTIFAIDILPTITSETTSKVTSKEFRNIFGVILYLHSLCSLVVFFLLLLCYECAVGGWLSEVDLLHFTSFETDLHFDFRTNSIFVEHVSHVGCLKNLNRLKTILYTEMYLWTSITLTPILKRHHTETILVMVFHFKQQKNIDRWVGCYTQPRVLFKSFNKSVCFFFLKQKKNTRKSWHLKLRYKMVD